MKLGPARTRGGEPLRYYVYLDVGPIIRRLRQNPSEFEMRGAGVHHRPSWPRLTLMRNRNDRIVALCHRIEFPISREQSAVLKAALGTWEEIYWRPLIARKTAERRITQICWRIAQICHELTRLFKRKTPSRQAFSAKFAWFGIGSRQWRRRGSRPHLRIVSSLPEETAASASLSPVFSVGPR